MDDLRIPYALKGGRIVSVYDVDKGLACGCTCPKCGQPLKARKGDVRVYHFAHHGDQQCAGAAEVTLYMLAIQILKDEGRVMAPAYKNVVGSGLIRFVPADAEFDRWGISIKPDVVGVCEDGARICIGLRISSIADQKKFSKLAGLDVRCLEIDIRECPLDESQLRSFLLESAESRLWVHHPEYERRYQDRLREKEERRRNIDSERMGQRFSTSNEASVLPSGQSQRWRDANKTDNLEFEREHRKHQEEAEHTRRLTPLPIQDGPIKEYYESLHPHAIFTEYSEAHTVVVNFGLSFSRKSVFVIHVNQPYKGVRFPFHLSQITYGENGYEYVHIGAYQTEQLAEWRLMKLKEDL